MADRSAREQEDQRPDLERAHRVVFGHLGPAILHETNNVLTVMTGVRQLLKMSRTLSDKVGTMIDQQLAKSERLLECVRRIGPDPEGGDDLASLVDAVAELIRLAGKGRGVTVRTLSPPQEGPRLAAPRGEPLALGLLCAVLPLLPPRAPAARAMVEMDVESPGAGLWLRCRVEPATAVAREDPELLLAGRILGAAGGAVEWRGEASGAVGVRAGFPAEDPSTPAG